MRKRSSKSAPGVKRPWLIECDEASHPLDADAVPLEAGVRCVPPAKASLGARRVTFSPAAIVIASLPDGWPQEGQNRASGVTSAAHAPQRTREF